MFVFEVPRTETVLDTTARERRQGYKADQRMFIFRPSVLAIVRYKVRKFADSQKYNSIYEVEVSFDFKTKNIVILIKRREFCVTVLSNACAFEVLAGDFACL